MNLKKTKYVLFLLMFLPFVGCERSATMPSFYRVNKSKASFDKNYVGDYVTLDFTAREGSLRSIFPIEDKSSGDRVSIKIKWEKNREYDIKCVLYNSNNPNQTTYSDIKVRVVDVRSDGTAIVKYKGDIRLSNGGLSGGEWYMQLFMGLSPEYWKEESKSYQLGQRLITDDIDMTLDIPIACPWTKLNVNAAGNHLSAPSVTLNPLGSIFALEIESPLCDPLPLKRIEINTGLFKGLGEFKLGEFREGGMPVFKELTNAARFKSKTTFDLNYRMPANYDTQRPKRSKKLYFWAMPDYDIRHADILGKLFISEDGDEYGLPIRSNRYSGNGLEERKTHKIVMKIQDSDLLISEFYHYNPAGWNYSMIELYNPTCRSIDLTPYSIIRQRTIWIDQYDGFIAKSGFQPSDDVSVIQDALRQDLYVPVSGEYSKVLDGRIAQDVHSSYCWGARSYYHLINGTYNKFLPPGKTIVLCAGGTYNAYVNTRKSSDYPEAYVGNYIKTAQNNGDIHYIIAVDNGRNLNDYQHSAKGGTMQHGQKQVMILMKGEIPVDVTGPFTYRNKNGAKPLDVSQLSNNTMLENYRVFTQQVPAFTASNDWSNMVRKDWDYYPSYYWDNNKRNGEWDRDSRWIFITGQGSGGSRLSSWGTRFAKENYFDWGFISRTQGSVVFYPTGINAN